MLQSQVALERPGWPCCAGLKPWVMLRWARVQTWVEGWPAVLRCYWLWV